MSINKRIFLISLFALFITTDTLFAKKQEPASCYSVQLISSRKPIQYSSRFPDGSKIMHIGRNYTVRNGCYDTVKELKKDFSKLSKGFPKAVIVSTYRFRFQDKAEIKTERKQQKKKIAQKSKRVNKTKKLQKQKKLTKNENLTHCRHLGCQKEKLSYPWEYASQQSAKKMVKLPQDVILPTVPADTSKPKATQSIKTEQKQESFNPDIYRFYINPFASIYEGQTPIGGSKLYSRTLKLALGMQYWHFFDKTWHFFTDFRIIPYYVDKNSFTKSDIRFDVKEFYLMSNGTFDNQANFLLGRKLLKDKRSWYYNTSLDTVGIFNKHDLLTYEIYGGTRLNSNVIIDGTSANKHDLKDIKFFIAHGSYEYYMQNKVELFALYEDTATAEDRKLGWIGFRAEGYLPRILPSFHYWIDLARVDGTSNQETIGASVKGDALDIGAEYSFNQLKDKVTLSFARGSGGENNNYTQPYLTNNRSDYLSRHLSFRYYGSFLDPELSNMNISSLFYSRKLDFTTETTAIIALHNYKQVVASNRYYSATNYTVTPNGQSDDLGNEIDFIVGQYLQGQYDWRFVLAYFLGGTAFDGVASDKDGLYGQFNFRYYW